MHGTLVRNKPTPCRSAVPMMHATAQTCTNTHKLAQTRTNTSKHARSSVQANTQDRSAQRRWANPGKKIIGTAPRRTQASSTLQRGSSRDPARDEWTPTISHEPTLGLSPCLARQKVVSPSAADRYPPPPSRRSAPIPRTPPPPRPRGPARSAKFLPVGTGNELHVLTCLAHSGAALRGAYGAVVVAKRKSRGQGTRGTRTETADEKMAKLTRAARAPSRERRHADAIRRNRGDILSFVCLHAGTANGCRPRAAHSGRAARIGHWSAADLRFGCRVWSARFQIAATTRKAFPAVAAVTRAARTAAGGKPGHSMRLAPPALSGRVHSRPARQPQPGPIAHQVQPVGRARAR